MTEGRKPEKQRPPRWDSYPLPGKYATPAQPRWDAGVRRWPEYTLLGISFALWVGLVVALGYSNGSLVAGAVVASYPTALILLPVRRHLVPREVGAEASPVPLRLWVLGWLLLAGGAASYSLFYRFALFSGSTVDYIVFLALFLGLIQGSSACLRRAPAWEQWRSRPRKKGRKSPPNGNGAPTGAVTLGQPN
jgi:hypothetical protein